jgi:hypothetical protein
MRRAREEQGRLFGKAEAIGVDELARVHPGAARRLVRRGCCHRSHRGRGAGFGQRTFFGGAPTGNYIRLHRRRTSEYR